MTKVVHICSHSSGLDELTLAQQADDREVLRHLDHVGRFSVFEATDNETIANTLDRIGNARYIMYIKEKAAYPWCYVELTPEGRALIEG